MTICIYTGNISHKSPFHKKWSKSLSRDIFMFEKEIFRIQAYIWMNENKWKHNKVSCRIVLVCVLMPLLGTKGKPHFLKRHFSHTLSPFHLCAQRNLRSHHSLFVCFLMSQPPHQATMQKSWSCGLSNKSRRHLKQIYLFLDYVQLFWNYHWCVLPT